MRIQCRCFRWKRLWRSALSVPCLALLAGALPSMAADIPHMSAPPAKTAVVLDFATPVSQSFLSAFSGEVRQPAQAVLPASTVWLLRRDFQEGQEYPQILQVELRGNCAPAEMPAHASPGPLGWVYDDGRLIHPVAFIDCDRVAATLASITREMPRLERQQMLARAVARVVVHELTHIETQSTHHAAHGIQQPRLTADELIAQKLPGGL
jgi:hypothetical protein